VAPNLMLSTRAAPERIIVAALLILTLARAYLANAIPLTDDEAYYRLWALSPALSYLDHPPMAGWFIAAGRSLAGDTALGIRLMAVLGSLLGAVAIWRTASLLFGATVGVLTVSYAMVIPLLSVGAIIITPDTPSVLFQLLALWALAELYVSGNRNWWLAVGAFAGLGLLSKYTGLFFGATAVLWLLFIPANRQWLRCWQLYAGGVIALALFMPVIAWNVEHDWASFSKQFGRVVSGDSFRLKWQLEMWGALLLLVSPILAWLAVRGLGRSIRGAALRSDQAKALLVFAIAPILLYFVFHAFRGRVQANWLAPVYPFFAIAAALATQEILSDTRRMRIAYAAGALAAFISTAIYVHALSPLIVRAEIKEPTHQMRGWAELSDEVAALAKTSGARWIATSSYATTGQLAFRLDGQFPVLQLTERIRYIHLPKPDDTIIKSPALYVELERRAKPELLNETFRSVTPLGHLDRKHNGIALARYQIYRIEDAADIAAVLRSD
jgi:4-amino-4-deoxy-L-arabinose transferase-like glycosyltransferase